MCRGLPILGIWFAFCFFCLLFAVDMQRVWLFAVYLALCLTFGPLILIFHTFCYEKIAARLFARFGLSVYKPCAPSRRKGEAKMAVVHDSPKVDLRKKHPVSCKFASKRKIGFFVFNSDDRRFCAAN